MEELNDIQIKELITEKLKAVLEPDCNIETELKNLFNEPEGKVVVLYNSSVYRESSNTAFMNRMKAGKFTVMITVRDPLNADIGLKHLETIIKTLHGIKFGPAEADRLYPSNDRFEEFIEGSEVWAYKVDFDYNNVVRISQENANQ